MSFLSDLGDDFIDDDKLEMIIENMLSIYSYSRNEIISKFKHLSGEIDCYWFDLFENYLKSSKYPLGIFADDELIVIFIDSEKYEIIDHNEIEKLLSEPYLIDDPDERSEEIEFNHLCAGLMYSMAMLLNDNIGPKEKIVQEMIYNDELSIRLGNLFQKHFGVNRPSFMIAISTTRHSIVL